MGKIRYIVFDFDGTLADTKIGIFGSIKYALNKMKMDFFPEERFIGPSPFYLYKEIFCLDEKSILKCVKNHRRYGNARGYKESKCYDGVIKTLGYLVNQGYKLFIVSNKKQKTLNKITKYLGLFKYFERIYGIEDEKSTKSDLFKKHLLTLIENNQILYVGDTQHDYDTCKENGIRFCFAKYGYGSIDSNDCLVINNFSDLRNLLIEK